MNDNATYYTFLRSARSFEELAKAKKRVQQTGLTYEEAREACCEYNKDRSEKDIRLGTKMEFTEG